MIKYAMNKYPSVRKIVNMLLLSIYFIIVVIVSAASQANPALVLIGTLPILIQIIVFNVIEHHKEMRHAVLWISPLVFSAMFFVLWNSKSINILNNMDGPYIFGFNIFFAYLFNIIILITEKTHESAYSNKLRSYKEQINRGQYEHNQQKQHYHARIGALESELEKAHSKLRITKENFSVKLKGIEDKCKAINFVIGRVYSVKKGGTPDIRKTLRINSELYNSFSDLSSNLKDKTKLIDVINRIYAQLLVLEKKERSLFTISAAFPAKRRHSDRIIDILKKNDKDPIEDYHSEAKEVCVNVMNFLKG